jgi:hypothetical protein
MRYTREYSAWVAMIRRCHALRDKDYPRWGGRGIKVCDAWRHSFAAFYEHIGPRPLGTSIDRIDGTRGYEPGNVRWATPLQQARNRRDAIYITFQGERLPIGEVGARLGVTRGAAYMRHKRGQL